MATISVITIVYNDLSGLKKTRRSVAEQTSSCPVEHLIVDGGSGHAMTEYLLSLGPSVKWVSEPDNGRYDAMNKGMRIATGDVMWFLHAGDTFGSTHSIQDAVSSVAEYSPSKPTWGYGLARKINHDGHTVGIFGNVPFDLTKFALGGKPVPHQAAFFTRRMLEIVGEYDLDHGLAADQLFMLKCALVSPPTLVVDFLCNFDASGAGSTRPVREHFRDMRNARKVAGFVPPGSSTKAVLLSIAAQFMAESARLMNGPRR